MDESFDGKKEFPEVARDNGIAVHKLISTTSINYLTENDVTMVCLTSSPFRNAVKGKHTIVLVVVIVVVYFVHIQVNTFYRFAVMPSSLGNINEI